MERFLRIATLLILCIFPAFAADTNCPEINTLQRWVGFLSWMGFLKTIGVVTLAIGFCIFFSGFILVLVQAIKDILDILMHIASIALIIAGAWTPEAYRLWPVLGGCILFGMSVQLTLSLRQIKDVDPKVISLLYMAAWGTTALWYNMPEVGFLAVAALMGLLGFSVIVSPFCYSFGFEDDATVAQGTGAAIMLLALYCIERVLFPSSSQFIKVFEPGVFWLGSLVGFCGLLILSNKWYVKFSSMNYAWIQFITITCYIAGVFLGMTFGINPLAGMAGTFLVFWVAAKMIEIPVESAMGVGIIIMLVGAVLSGAWYVGSQNMEVIKKYLTTNLPV